MQFAEIGAGGGASVRGRERRRERQGGSLQKVWKAVDGDHFARLSLWMICSGFEVPASCLPQLSVLVMGPVDQPSQHWSDQSQLRWMDQLEYSWVDRLEYHWVDKSE